MPDADLRKAVFPATLRGKWTSTDDEGESIIKITVPASHQAEVLKLHQWLGKLLRVTIEPDPSDVGGA